MKSNRTPKWDKWRHIPDVEIWKAIALSLNIDPEQVDFDQYSWMVGRVIFKEGEEFNDRFEILQANLGNTISPTLINSASPHRCCVNVQQFVSWALSLPWHIPIELAEMAEKMETPVSEKKQSPTLDPREKDSLLLIIAALLKKLDWKIDDRNVAGLIKRQIEILGCSLSDKAVRNHIRSIPDAVERKQK